MGLLAVQSGANVILQWLSAEEEDFSYHNIYRNNLDNSDPAMVFTTSDSFYVDLDMTGGSWEYWITAVDSAGNESDATRMAKDVDKALHTIIETHGKHDQDTAIEYVNRLKLEKRYVRDVY